MIEQSLKSLPKSDAQSENSTDKKKSRHFPTRACGCGKLASPVRSDSKPAPEHPFPEAYQANFENSSERQRLRMKLLETRNVAEETSEGVQQFIRHVSSFIEKKNPFKDKVLYPSDGSGKNVAPDDSIEFHLMRKPSADSLKSRPLSLERLSDTVLEESYEQKQKVPEKLSLLHTSRKISEWNSGNKTFRGTRKSEYAARKYQKEHSPDIKRIFESAPVKKQDRRSPIEMGRRKGNSPGGSPHREGPPGLSPIKKKKPSEIPLRKSRMSSRATARKQISKLHMNFYDIYTTDKSFTSLEELNLSSELKLALNMTCTSEKLNYKDQKVFLATKEHSPDSRKSKKMARHSKSSKVTAVYSSELLEENPDEASPYRIIDLNKMQTTSFTILKSDNVFNSIENIQKKNTLGKKKSAHNKSSSLYPKSKASVKTVKGKVSKKNLCRTSSKGNKPGLKAKTKRSKKEMNLFKKESLGSNEKSIHQCLVTGKAWWERRKTTAYAKVQPQKEAGAFHVPVKLVRTKAKSFLRGIEAPRKKECLRKLPGVSQGLNHDQKTEMSKPGSLTTIRLSNEGPTTKEDKFEDESKNGEEILASSPSKAEEDSTNTGEEKGMKLSSTTTSNEKLNMCDSLWIDFGSETKHEKPDGEGREKAFEKDTGGSVEASEVKISDFIKGMLGKDEPPEGEDLPKVKKRIRIDLNPTENILKCKTIENNTEPNAEPFDWLFLNEKNYEDEPPCDVAHTNNSESERITEGSIKSGQDTAADSFSSEPAEESVRLSVSIQKLQRSCSSLKRKRGEEKRLHKSSDGATKISRKKKIRSDSGGRRMPSPGGFFNSDIALLNKVVPDVRQRSGLTKSYVRDEKKDIFEDLTVVKLKRRNSEPHSLRGYVWKCTDAATTRGHKPSVSSLASSLRHLNTDDIDDFTFWEAIPQRKTPWETSLYHFKRPWSVLSCSIFKDNRRSNTPGLILENLRNGGSLRRFTTSENERQKCHKENPFDVEPSIAQKNIDVRNWLAALNFPMIPSTSNDFLGENNYGGQSSSEAQSLHKTQVRERISQGPLLELSQTTPRHRKIVSNLKFSGETSDKVSDEAENLKKSNKWNGSDGESLTELTKRISGGFLSNEQYVNSEHSIWPNATLTLCVYSKSFEESFLMEASDANFATEIKSVDVGLQPQSSMSTISVVDARGDQLAEKFMAKEKPAEIDVKAKGTLSSFLNVELNDPDLNIWKYLFLFTIFIVAVNYIFLSG